MTQQTDSKVLAECERQVALDLEWAKRTLQDEAWLSFACDYSIETALRYALTPASELALRLYHYWHMRAHSTYAPYGNTNNLQPCDSSARERWIATGGKLDQ